MSNLSNNNEATSGLQSLARGAEAVQLNTCIANSGGGSFEFFSPDKNGDANSTEQQYFFDAACSQLARDIVRIWTSTGSGSETINRTDKIYASGNATPIASRTDAVTLKNATFDQYGYPIPANGFARAAQGNLVYASNTTIDSDYELVMSPISGGSESFCSDLAGYNATGFPALNETFGWQGQVASGTRTVNSDGSVTWSATQMGSTSKGAIGSLSITVGTQNTSCPIATPMFALAGGTSGGAFTIPATATYKAGLLIGLTIANASLPNGMTLNVTTNTSVSPFSSQFISGVVSNGTTQVATFTADAFGNGTLTVTSSGAQYVITDWHVVR